MGTNRFIHFCIKGLEKTYLPSENLFSASRQLVCDRMEYFRDRRHEYRFTMNALMGLQKAKTQGYEIFLDIEADYHRMAQRVHEMADSPEDIAATAWTGRTIGTTIPQSAASLFHSLLNAAPNVRNLTAKALAWMIIACVTGDKAYQVRAHDLVKLAESKYIHDETGLVREHITGIRRNWSSFGANAYIAYALLLYGRQTGDDAAIDKGLLIVRKLVELQGPDGQWGWMYHVPTGRIADFYPVYSVHQYAYAPFFLLEAIDLGHSAFREPLIHGFRWIFGHNEMDETMVDPKHHIVWRRVFRGGLNAKLVKIFRGIAVVQFGINADIAKPGHIQIDRQCWGFEMALPLCVFSGRDDFSEILDDNCFA